MKRSLFTHDDRIRMKLITAVAAQLPREADAYAACGTPFGPDDHAYAIWMFSNATRVRTEKTMMTTRLPAIALLAILLPACMAPLQTTSSGDTANAIIIETADTPEDAYRRMSQILLSETFTIDHSDSSIRTLSTDWKPIRGNAQRMRLTVAVFDGSSTRIQLTGTLMVASLGESRIEAVGQSGSPNERSWSEMDRVARLYPDAVVRYERR